MSDQLKPDFEAWWKTKAESSGEGDFWPNPREIWDAAVEHTKATMWQRAIDALLKDHEEKMKHIKGRRENR